MSKYKIDYEKVDERAKEIADQGIFSEESAKEKILNLGPKKLYKMGLLEGDGWREGSTKKSLEKRKQQRRKKKGKK